MQEQLMFWHKYTCLKCTTGTAEVLLCYHIKTHQLGHWAQAKCEYTSGTETPVQLQNGISLHTECTSGSVLSLSLFVRSHPFQFSTFFPLLNAVECLPIRAATSYPPLPPERLGSDTITCSRKRQRALKFRTFQKQERERWLHATSLTRGEGSCTVVLWIKRLSENQVELKKIQQEKKKTLRSI